MSDLTHIAQTETAEQAAERERNELLDKLVAGLPAKQKRMVKGIAGARPNPETVLYACQAHVLADLNEYKSAFQAERNRWDKNKREARRLRAEAKRVEDQSPERARACRKEALALEKRPPMEDRFHVVTTGMVESARKIAQAIHTINPTTYDKVVTEAVSDVIESDDTSECYDRMTSPHDDEFLPKAEAEEREGL